MIRLYRAPFSTNVERVALALAHKGLEVELVTIAYEDRGEVERVSGQGLVPVIDDDGTIVADSMTIVLYLEEHYPDAPLYPAEPARRAEMLVFIDWFNRVWKRPPNEIEAELGRDAPDEARISALSAEMAGALDLFEAMLTNRPYLMGHQFSAADCAAFPFLKYALLRDPADDELFHRVLERHQRLGDRHPQLRGWIERVDLHPRVTRATRRPHPEPAACAEPALDAGRLDTGRLDAGRLDAGRLDAEPAGRGAGWTRSRLDAGRLDMANRLDAGAGAGFPGRTRALSRTRRTRRRRCRRRRGAGRGGRRRGAR